MANKNLTNAKSAKNDEFYTQLKDIENELQHYTTHFKDKVIYCNADDPNWSKFYKYFYDNFNKLQLKKLISTFYSKQKSYKTIYENGKVTQIELTGNGDFRSEECIDILKEVDIIVTNPPFSLFREFVAQLMEYNKKFLVIGSMNAITYKEIFPLIKNSDIWLGVNKPIKFEIPYIPTQAGAEKLKNGNHLVKLGNINWYTNLQHNKRNQKLNLTEDFDIEKYPMYDNYNAIEVSRTNNIPKNYNGAMGVPISFLNKYNPNQFEILGADFEIQNGDLSYLKVKDWKGKVDRGYINGKRIYSRIIIKHK